MQATQDHEEYERSIGRLSCCHQRSFLHSQAWMGIEKIPSSQKSYRLQKRVFEDNPSLGIVKKITDIIASYAVYYPHNYYGERANAAKKVVDEITGATSETY